MSYIASLAVAWLVWMHYKLIKSENDVLKDEKLAKARVVKQQKYDKPEPVLSEKLTKTTYFDFVLNQLNNGCKVCLATPLLLT